MNVRFIIQYSLKRNNNLMNKHRLSILAFCAIAFLANQPCVSGAQSDSGKPVIQKLGTIDCDMVEVTPVVFKDNLYRFEYIRDNYKLNKTGQSYFRFIDGKSQQPTPAFAAGFHLGCAYAQGDTMYVYGVPSWGGGVIQVFWSKDLIRWKSKEALNLPGWKIFNTSVCRGPSGYAMAFEIDAPPEEAGKGFTMRFAASDDLLSWKLTSSECVYTKERYSACPALRFFEPYYYMVYLEAYDGPAYLPHIVRSRDLIRWDSSPFNPILKFSDDDKKIANPNLTEEQRKAIAEAVNINNSDVDFCEFQGKVVINYSWGNQKGTEFMAKAVYEGTLKDFLQDYFPQ